MSGVMLRGVCLIRYLSLVSVDRQQRRNLGIPMITLAIILTIKFYLRRPRNRTPDSFVYWTGSFGVTTSTFTSILLYITVGHRSRVLMITAESFPSIIDV